MTVAAQRLRTDRVFEMLRQSEHLQCRPRQALAIFSFIVIFYIDFSFADNNAGDIGIPDTDLLSKLAPLKIVGDVITATTGMGNSLIKSLKELDKDNIGGAVQYMQSQFATRRIGNFYRFGGRG